MILSISAIDLAPATNASSPCSATSSPRLTARCLQSADAALEDLRFGIGSCRVWLPGHHGFSPIAFAS
jgi:hypothetical protein